MFAGDSAPGMSQQFSNHSLHGRLRDIFQASRADKRTDVTLYPTLVDNDRPGPLRDERDMNG